MRYRRANIEGGTYFFTVNLAERQRTLLIDEIDSLRQIVREVRQRHPFHVDAFVVLPDHLHALWTLPVGDADFAMRWALIKAGFSRRIAKTERRSLSRVAKGERGIWQRRYWEHLVKDDGDFEKHLDYIHYNPVKHGYVARAADWPYSSLHRVIAQRIVSADWGGVQSAQVDGDFGER